MPTVPEDLRRRLDRYQQGHVLHWWGQLDESQQRGLLDQLRALDLELLQRLYSQRDQGFTLPPEDSIQPAPVTHPDEGDAATRQPGESALRRGEVAVLMVAGGQGSRLGYDLPKGMFPIGPVSDKSLYQIHAEKVLALRRRYGAAVPFLIMTSGATHEQTLDFFAEHRDFGLPREEVHFFQQGTMPALDLGTGEMPMERGKLLMEAPGRLFTSPNGHGGTLAALVDSGLLERLQRQGVRQVFYFQVDNPLVRVADPLFLGQHLAARAEVSSKIVPKLDPKDRLGNMVLVNGRCSMIEYSDLPEKLATRTDARGRLWIWAGSVAIHIFAVDFLARVSADPGSLPFHLARKKVPCIDAEGRPVRPEKENALKFEKFIFDVLPLADRWTVVETTRRDEFAPLKNATGPDSEPTVRQAIGDLAGDWLERAGVRVPRQSDGSSAVPLEISPLFALDPQELAAKVDRGTKIEGPTYLTESPGK
jgi:UDP-N-acetylglucosamine/UDP-N-acetylgalactosamine diphosphorylase